MNIVDQLLDWKVDGIISDCTSLVLSVSVTALCSRSGADPNVVRRHVKQRGLPTAPKLPKQRVLKCLEEHLEKQRI